MGLTFTEKSDLNNSILKEFRLILVDKEQPVLPPGGKIYNHFDPANESLLGSVGQCPDPTFDAYQPPNAMGMVLLIVPEKVEDSQHRIRLSVSGQFDVSHRFVPDIKVMRQNLKAENGKVKASQSLVTSYKRMTVLFEPIVFDIKLPTNLNDWIKPSSNNPLENALEKIEHQLVHDPRVFKLCHTLPSGGAKFDLDWCDEAIKSQSDFNKIVSSEIFKSQNEVLPYSVQIRVRVRKAPVSLSSIANAHLVEIYIENNTSREKARTYGIDNPHLIDTSLKVKIERGAHKQLPHKLEPEDYRYEARDGVPGYGVTTSVKQICDSEFATDAMPIAKLERVESPTSADLKFSKNPKFDDLASDPLSPLDSLVKAINEYQVLWEKQIESLIAQGKSQQATVSRSELQSFIRETEHIEDGIALLHKHHDLRRCFQWMNTVMSSAIRKQRKTFDEWRLFQLGFILTQIRAVYERCCPRTEITNHIETAEVLWFSTGGGKTEAYLGILIMGMLYERMNDRGYGTTGWMRFPLRMLSVQQFQRLSYVVAQANIIRQKEKLGGHPFTIGYFTGGGTPSRITSASSFYRHTFLPSLGSEALNKLKFIHDCPYCDSENSVQVVNDLLGGRIKHVCTNDQCWSNTQAEEGQYGEGIKGELGIYVSDEEVYRYLPTIMVGTIDKLAVIGHNERFRYFFGGATHFCPTHGFSFTGKCAHWDILQLDDGSWENKKCANNSRTSKIRTHALPDLRFPGFSFLIQDELHLLSENTGNFNAHYETLLTSIQKECGGRSPKVLAATATIKDYENHIHHLYQRHARRFPVPGYKLGESFYARVKLDSTGKPMIRRIFAGIMPLGAGRAMYRATAAASARYLTLIDQICDQIRSDPTGVAKRLGMHQRLLHDVKRHIEEYLNANLLYVNSKVGIREVDRHLEEVHRDIYQDRKWLQLDGQSSLDEIQQAIQHIESKKANDQTRQITATSVVSHGVDIHRLNAMVIAGWPKSIAEYMQTSARAGRIEPGIVLTVLNAKQLFQANVFMDYQDYHLFMEKLVESVPVNRFAPNLLDKTLPGIFAAWIYCWAPARPWGTDITRKAGKIRIALKDHTFKARDELKKVLTQSLSVPEYQLSSFDSRVTSDFMHMLDVKIDQLLTQFEHMKNDIAEDRLTEALSRLLGNKPMTSMRDIESQISVVPQTEETQAVLDALER
jgi:hypothetical protein